MNHLITITTKTNLSRCNLADQSCGIKFILILVLLYSATFSIQFSLSPTVRCFLELKVFLCVIALEIKNKFFINQPYLTQLE